MLNVILQANKSKLKVTTNSDINWFKVNIYDGEFQEETMIYNNGRVAVNHCSKKTE